MLKKLASLLLSLLLCLSLLPGQAMAGQLPEPPEPPAVEEPAGPGTPEDPEDPVMPLANDPAEPPIKGEEGHAN